MKLFSKIREILCNHNWHILHSYSTGGYFISRSVCLKCGKFKRDVVKQNRRIV